MFKIINKVKLSSVTTLIEIEAPLVARNARAGQFVVLINDEKGERIPLTLADWDSHKGTISLIFQEVGLTTKKLSNIETGHSIAHVLGPLGHPTEMKKIGRIVCIGGGVGIAEIFPVAREFKKLGNEIIAIIGARNKELLILEDKLKSISDELHITTDDGSYGRKGFVTDVLKEIIKLTNLVYAVGPIPMMQAVSKFTLPFKIKTIVSLNPIMLDATGMCGTCRCSVGREMKFACVDGPDFDAHQVDFEELAKRLNQFKEQERINYAPEGKTTATQKKN